MAIVDPMMVLKLPPNLTAATGIDALSHAIESALSKFATPFTQALALESVRLVSKNLRKATQDGSDLEARTDMSWATLIEGFAEGNAGDVEGHWIAHVIGPYYELHHGVACAIALPYCMEFNLPVNEAVLARIAEAMDTTLTGLSTRKAAEGGICAVSRLIEDVGLPSKLAGVGNAGIKDIPELVGLYLNNPNVAELFGTFTKRVPIKKEVTELFGNMFDGVLRSKA
jgi:alcohol dehydrogenase